MNSKIFFKLALIISLGVLIFFLTTQTVLIFYVQDSKFDVSWGISVQYNYIVFATLMLITTFASYRITQKWHIIFLLLSYIVFLLYWYNAISVYPFRVLFFLSTGLFIFMASNYIAYTIRDTKITSKNQ